MPHSPRRTPSIGSTSRSGQALVSDPSTGAIYLGKYGIRGKQGEVPPPRRRVACVGNEPQARTPPVLPLAGDHLRQRSDPGLLDARQAAVRQERPAHQRDPELPDRPAPPPPTLRPRTGHQLRPPGPGRLPPETDRGRHLPQADQPARRPHPPVFKWGVARELVPETVWRALCAVEGLRVRRGPRDRAGQAGPRRAHHGRRAVRHAADLGDGQPPALDRLPARRGLPDPRTIDINMQGDLGVPAAHPQGRAPRQGAGRLLGPHAQEVIKPWLKTDLHAYLFSPREARACTRPSEPRNERRRPRRSPNQTEAESETHAGRGLRRLLRRKRWLDWLWWGYHAFRRRFTGLDDYRRHYFADAPEAPTDRLPPPLKVEWINNAPAVVEHLQRSSIGCYGRHRDVDIEGLRA